MVDARRSKTHPYSILQVPTTQLAKMSIDLKFVELTADVLKIFLIKYRYETTKHEKQTTQRKRLHGMVLLVLLCAHGNGG